MATGAGDLSVAREPGVVEQGLAEIGRVRIEIPCVGGIVRRFGDGGVLEDPSLLGGGEGDREVDFRSAKQGRDAPEQEHQSTSSGSWARWVTP